MISEIDCPLRPQEADAHPTVPRLATHIHLEATAQDALLFLHLQELDRTEQAYTAAVAKVVSLRAQEMAYQSAKMFSIDEAGKSQGVKAELAQAIAYRDELRANRAVLRHPHCPLRWDAMNRHLGVTLGGKLTLESDSPSKVYTAREIGVLTLRPDSLQCYVECAIDKEEPFKFPELATVMVTWTWPTLSEEGQPRSPSWRPAFHRMLKQVLRPA